VLIANALFWFAMLPELRQYFRLRREGELPDEQQVAEFMGMGSVYREVKRFNLTDLFKKTRAASERALTERICQKTDPAGKESTGCPWPG